jgi:hypothetical protein
VQCSTLLLLLTVTLTGLFRSASVQLQLAEEAGNTSEIEDHKGVKLSSFRDFILKSSEHMFESIPFDQATQRLSKYSVKDLDLDFIKSELANVFIMEKNGEKSYIGVDHTEKIRKKQNAAIGFSFWGQVWGQAIISGIRSFALKVLKPISEESNRLANSGSWQHLAMDG